MLPTIVLQEATVARELLGEMPKQLVKIWYNFFRFMLHSLTSSSVRRNRRTVKVFFFFFHVEEVKSGVGI